MKTAKKKKPTRRAPATKALVMRQGVRADIYNQDCIAGMAERLSSNSVHLTVTSIPFEEL